MKIFERFQSWARKVFVKCDPDYMGYAATIVVYHVSL